MITLLKKRNRDSYLDIIVKNAKLPFRAPERPTSLFYSYKKGTHMDITKYILKFMDKHKDIIHMYHILS